MFPVCRVAKKDASREVGRSGILFSFFSFSIFINFLIQKVGGKKTFFSKNMKKKFQSALLYPLGRSTGNNFLFKGGLKSLRPSSNKTCSPAYLLQYVVALYALYVLAKTRLVPRLRVLHLSTQPIHHRTVILPQVRLERQAENSVRFCLYYLFFPIRILQDLVVTIVRNRKGAINSGGKKSTGNAGRVS